MLLQKYYDGRCSAICGDTIFQYQLLEFQIHALVYFFRVHQAEAEETLALLGNASAWCTLKKSGTTAERLVCQPFHF